MISERKGKPHFYVHYDKYNKRLDEWIPPERIDLSKEVEWPVDKKDDKKKTNGTQATKAQPIKVDKKLGQKKSKLDRELSGTQSQSRQIFLENVFDLLSLVERRTRIQQVQSVRVSTLQKLKMKIQIWWMWLKQQPLQKLLRQKLTHATTKLKNYEHLDP